MTNDRMDRADSNWVREQDLALVLAAQQGPPRQHGKLPRQSSATTRGTMYELYVLGQLIEEPMHGYLLPQILSSIIGPFRSMSWGALYPLIHRLDEAGLIEPVERDDRHGARQRKAYAITDAGRTRFQELMAERGEYDANFRDVFTIKLSRFGAVSRKIQLDILRHYEGYVQELRNHIELQLGCVSDNPQIPERERPGILRALNHNMQLVSADMRWIEDEIAATEDAITGQSGAR